MSRDQRGELRIPAVGVGLLYSALEDRHVRNFGQILKQASASDRSLHGLSFDITEQIAVGQVLALLLPIPGTQEQEYLISKVRWCRELSPGHYRVGVYVEASDTMGIQTGDTRFTESVGTGIPAPTSIPLMCPACGTKGDFYLVGNQAITHRAGMMPLYNCPNCETTRTITGILGHDRQQEIDKNTIAKELCSTSLNLEKSQNMPELKRILYVEDEPDIRAVANIALVNLGNFEVKACVSGQDALDSVVDFSPDMLLLDVMMPGMNGPEALQAIRSLPDFEKIPAIFMTAKIQPTEVEGLKALGIIDVIGKPFDPMTLAAQIRELWSKYHSE